jgi:hypothetical protein
MVDNRFVVGVGTPLTPLPREACEGFKLGEVAKVKTISEEREMVLADKCAHLEAATAELIEKAEALLGMPWICCGPCDAACSCSASYDLEAAIEKIKALAPFTEKEKK